MTTTANCCLYLNVGRFTCPHRLPSIGEVVRFECGAELLQSALLDLVDVGPGAIAPGGDVFQGERFAGLCETGEDCETEVDAPGTAPAGPGQ